MIPLSLDDYDCDIVAEREVASFGFVDAPLSLNITGEVSLNCVDADAVGLVVRYEDGGVAGGESRCLVRFDAGSRLRYSPGLDGRCRLDVVS